jgi:putative salt-induced outer membrane protein
MKISKTLALTITTATVLSTVSLSSFAQATVKDDGQWRAAMGLSASVASGNTEATIFNANADAVRKTKDDKVSLYGTALYGKTNGVKSVDALRFGGRYDWNFLQSFFAFGGADVERDKIAGLSSRLSLNGGVGYHVINTPETTWDVFGGAGYTMDRYDAPRLIGNNTIDSYNYANLLLGEESNHKLGESTSFKQRFIAYPNLKDSKAWRSQFDAGLAVAMSKAMSLNVGLSNRYNNEPGAGFKKSDTLLTTGISYKWD